MKSIITHIMEPVVPRACAVMTVGGGLAAKKIYVRRLGEGPVKTPGSPIPPDRPGDWKPWKVLQVTGEAVTVDVPSVPFGVYELTLDPADPPENRWVVNRPRLDWSWPKAAVAGEPIRFMGRCLADVSKYRTVDPAQPVSYGGLRPRQTVLLARRVGEAKWVRIPVRCSSAYEVHAEWPATLPTGDYEVAAHNGRGGAAGWSEPFRLRVERATAWPRKVFRVDAHRKAAGGNVDEAVARALAELQANGGGILQFGAGTYGITRTIEVPPRCVVRGEGADRTCICGPGQAGPLPPWVMITGDGDFVVEDLRLFAIYSPIAIAAPVFRPATFEAAMKAPFAWGDTRARNVTVRRCRIEQAPQYNLPRRKDADPAWRKWLTDWIATSDGQSHNGFVAIRVRGDGGVIEENEIWGAGSGVILTGCSHLRVARNAIKIGTSGHGIYIMGHMSWPEDWATNPEAKPYPVIGNYSNRVIVEENRIEAHSERARDFCYFNYGAEYCLAARNTIGPMQINNDCEGLAFHLWPAKWVQPKVEMIGPTRYRIIDPTGEVRREELVGSVLQVLDGAGIGQIRTVVARQGDEVEIDKPFRYAPGAASVIAFSAPPPFRGMTVVDNTVTHTGANILLWGDTQDVVVDGNVCRDNGHITVWSIRSFEEQKVWGGAAFTQILHNRSEMAWMMPETPEQTAGCFGAGIGNPCSRNMKVDPPVGFDFLGFIVRDNACRNQSGIVYRTRYVVAGRAWKLHDAGVVVERNFSEDNQFGVAVEADAPAVVRNNKARRTRWPVVRFPPVMPGQSGW